MHVTTFMKTANNNVKNWLKSFIFFFFIVRYLRLRVPFACDVVVTKSHTIWDIVLEKLYLSQFSIPTSLRFNINAHLYSSKCSSTRTSNRAFKKPHFRCFAVQQSLVLQINS